MKFTKMQGIGNDYVYVNCFEEKVEDPSALAIQVSDRHFGIGSDGLILICPSEVADCEMAMYNADGSRGEMCGNGVRCVGKYMYDYVLNLEVKDGNNINAIDKAICKAKLSKDKPTLIIVHTVIGYGSKNQGTSKVHGSPLGVEDGKNAKVSYGFDYPEFTMPKYVYNQFKKTFAARGKKAYEEWKDKFQVYSEKYPEEAKKFVSTMNNDVSSLVYDKGPYFEPGFKDSTRNSSQALLNILNKSVYNLIGGSADVAGSVKTAIKGETDFTPENRGGRNVNFGIREFAMASIQNGILLHGGIRSYVGCFLVFADYLKPAIRMASLSHLPAIYLFSHDTIAVGEDGPTHQPIEQLAMLRSIPHNYVYRPCDANELSISYGLLNYRFYQ